MSDLNLGLNQIVLNKVESTLTSFTHDDMTVVWTATMKNGSIVNASGVEVAVAGAATSVGVIDDIIARNYAKTLTVGESITVAVAKRGCVFNEANVKFTDAAINAAGKTALAAQLNQFA